jgi:hypothetical protein
LHSSAGAYEIKLDEYGLLDVRRGSIAFELAAQQQIARKFSLAYALQVTPENVADKAANKMRWSNASLRANGSAQSAAR